MPDLQSTGDRVEALLQRFTGPLAPKDAHSAAEELVSLLTELYGAGLERTLEIVHDASAERADAIFDSLAADKLVASLLILHGLHPQTLEERVQAALGKVRPYLNSHEGDIEILRIAEGVVHLRLAGSCHGCPSSLATVKLTVETAILEAAPEIGEVRVQGLSTAETSERYDSDWISLDAHSALAANGLCALDVAGAPVLLVSDGRLVRAYRNQCPRCLHGLSGAVLEWPTLVCRSCDERYDVANAGHSENAAALAIEGFPVAYDVHDARRVRLAIPVTA
ncbi:MAG: NifU family protein [Candidatus Eremiobacteraeota bacterium]|nr:NifU family protein [Candidatus Eremiobacteraeota bacterium]